MNGRICKKPFLCNDIIFILLNLSICRMHQVASWVGEKLFLKYLRKTVTRIWKQCLKREFLDMHPSAEWSIRNNLDFILQSFWTAGIWLLGFNCFFWSAQIMEWQLTICIKKRYNLVNGLKKNEMHFGGFCWISNHIVFPFFHSYTYVNVIKKEYTLNAMVKSNLVLNSQQPVNNRFDPLL